MLFTVLLLFYFQFSFLLHWEATSETTKNNFIVYYKYDIKLLES